MTLVHDRRANRDRPYQREQDYRITERMERQATMPKDLPGLLRWFMDELRAEMPDALHGTSVWRDRVSTAEDQQPVGASDTGALAYTDEFRRILENGPSEVDRQDSGTDGRAYYLRPVAAAISRIGRGRTPLMARHLLYLAAANMDWRRRADLIGWAHEEYEVYIREALIRLWRECRDWTRSS